MALAAAAAGAVHAQTWPNKAVHFVVPLAPGGAVDVLARQIAQRMSATWGQPFVVDNRGGAGTVIGTDYAAKAPADGYTFLFVISSHLANPSLYASLPYDTAKAFAPVSLLVTGPLVVVVNQSLPVATLPELIAYSKTHPGTVNYATGSTADVGHLTGERLQIATGASLTHVPYKGATAALNDLLGGTINMMINTPSALLPFIRSGKLKALAVTSAARSDALPGVPSIAETTGDRSFDMSTFYGLLAPAGTPQTIIDKVSAEAGAIVRSPEVSASLLAQGFKPVGSTPKELGTYIDDGLKQSAVIVKRAGIKAE